MSAPTTDVWPEVGARVATARQQRGMTQRDLAHALGTTPWEVDRIESGAVDGGRYLSSISEVTQTNQEWFASSAGTESTSTARAHNSDLAHLGAAGKNLVLGSIVLLVTIRLFTEVVPLLPRAGNFVDIPIVLTLALAATFVPTSRRGAAYLGVGLPALLFLTLTIVSVIANSHRVAPAPVLVFVYGFLAPLAVYAAVYRIWPPGCARSLSRALVVLGLLELAVVAVIDLPRFLTSGDPDQITGTFGTNAYQLVFFMLVVATLLAGIFTLEPKRAVSRFVPLLIFAIFVVVMLSQYRALLATTVVTMAVVGVLLGRHARGILVAVFTVIAFGLAFSYVASSFPNLKLEGTATTLVQNPSSYASQRYQASRPVRELYRDEPFVAAVGTGPGTFSSRAWQTFATAGSTSSSNVQGDYAQGLTGGSYETDVSKKYVLPQRREGSVVEGSRAVSAPYSSYFGLVAEVGLLGLAFIVGVYLAALFGSYRIAKKEIAEATGSDPIPALALATTIGFLMLLQMGLLENWLEVTRITFVVWAMFAICCKELDARDAT